MRFSNPMEIPMKSSDPVQVVESFVEAMNRQDIDQAIAHYEPGAVLMAQPGHALEGIGAIRDALAAMVAGSPRLATRHHKVFVCGDLALYHAAWTMNERAPDGSEVVVAGESADVLRRQPNGEWRIAIDNPWGVVALAQ
jgi:ketosteroid isomerase-like protein